MKTLDSGIFAEKATRYLSSTYVFNEKIKKLDVDDGDHDDDAANAAVDADSLENSNNCWLPWLQISPAMGPRRMVCKASSAQVASHAALMSKIATAFFQAKPRATDTGAAKNGIMGRWM